VKSLPRSIGCNGVQRTSLCFRVCILYTEPTIYCRDSPIRPGTVLPRCSSQPQGGREMPHPEKPPQTTGRSKRVQIRLDPTLKQESRIHLTKANMTWQDLLVPYTCHFVEEAHRRMAGPSKPTMQTHPRQALPPQSTPIPLSTSVELAALLGEAHSLELPIGSPTYRRWMHHCNRCGQFWVTEMVTLQCCHHCLSPYWNRCRTRRGRALRGTHATALG